MNQPSEKVYDIISRMTDDEKEYFRRYSQILKQFNHVSTARLLEFFEATNGMKVYNETKLKQRISYSLSNGSFKTYKSVLHELILESLHVQHNSGNSTLIEQRQFNYAEILIEKGLHVQAISKINHLQNTTRIETTNGNSLLSLQLLELKTRALHNMHGSKMDDKTAARFALYQQALQFQQEQEQELITTYLDEMASHSLLLNLEHDEAQFKEMQKITNCFLQKVNNPNNYYVVRQGISVSLLEADFIKHADHCHHLFSHYWQLSLKKTLAGDERIEFANSYAALIRASMLAKDEEMLFLLFNITKSTYFNYFSEHPYYLYYLHFSLLCYLWLAGVGKDIENLLLWFETNACPAQTENDMQRFRWFYTTLAIMYHSIKESKSALRCVHKVINTSPNDLTELHYRCFCVLFRFVIETDQLPVKTFEEQNYFDRALAYSITILKKQHSLIEGKKNRSYELAFMDFMKAETVEDKESSLAKLKSFSHLPSAKQYNALFDFTGWVVVKLNKMK